MQKTNLIPKTHQNDALAEMVDGGGIKNVPSRFERPIVVIGGHSLEGEVVDSVGSENGRKSSHSVAICAIRGNRGRCRVKIWKVCELKLA